MCGRYVRRSDKQQLAEHFHAQPQPAELPLPDEDYNVAPTTYQPIVRQGRETGERELVLARWGLVPFFTRDLKEVKSLATINARSETITRVATWREPFKKRRCLVPATAFYEWPKDTRPPRKPYAFTLKDGGLFALAGLWDAWRDSEGHWLQSFAVVTTEANELMRKIHPRMPVILRPQEYDRWLDREQVQQPPIDLLWPYASEEMSMFEANAKVNHARNNGPEMMRAVEDAAEMGELPL